MDCIFQKRLANLLPNKTPGVADSKNVVIVEVVLQWESTSRQLEIQVIQRCKVGLWKASSDSEMTCSTLNECFLSHLSCHKVLPWILSALDSRTLNSSILALCIHISMYSGKQTTSSSESAAGRFLTNTRNITALAHIRINVHLLILLLKFESILVSEWKMRSLW